MTAEPIDLGHDHQLFIVGRHGLDGMEWGAIVEHRTPAGAECMGGYITFDGPVQREQDPGRPKWVVESREPLTLIPSLLCTQCGDHGFVREGRWVRA